jgi:hypothetical protein
MRKRAHLFFIGIVYFRLALNLLKKSGRTTKGFSAFCFMCLLQKNVSTGILFPFVFERVSVNLSLLGPAFCLFVHKSVLARYLEREGCWCVGGLQ